MLTPQGADKQHLCRFYGHLQGRVVELISFNLWSQITERGSFASHANLFQVQKVEGLEPCRNPTAFTEGAGKWPAEEQTWTNHLPTGYTVEALPGLPALPVPIDGGHEGAPLLPPQHGRLLPAQTEISLQVFPLWLLACSCPFL